MNRKAIIYGIKGYKLTRNEKLFFQKSKPWGIILFSRNIKNILQLKILISDIKKLTKDRKFPILIDQEGGKVSRLNKIIDLSTFSQSYFAYADISFAITPKACINHLKFEPHEFSVKGY